MSEINSFENMNYGRVAITHQIELIKHETERLHRMLAQQTLLMLGAERNNEGDLE